MKDLQHRNKQRKVFLQKQGGLFSAILIWTRFLPSQRPDPTAVSFQEKTEAFLRSESQSRCKEKKGEKNVKS